jgi:hypothetical protein
VHSITGTCRDVAIPPSTAFPIGLPANSRFTTPNPSFGGLAFVLPPFPKVTRCVKIGIPVLLQAKIVAACEDFSARESRELIRMDRMRKPRKT